MGQLPPAARAYLAGVVDTVAILRTREVRDSGLLPMVAVHGGPPAVLEHLAAATGTRVTWVEREYPRQPCSLHCDEPHSHVSSRSGRWSVTGSRATILLYNLAPYMQVQRGEAERLVALGTEAGWKSSAVEWMAALGFRAPALKAQPRARLKSVP